jgi:predicted homoserine dehydrogenase-like protein
MALRELPGRRIGVIGTGFIARHFVRELLRRSDWALAGVLTRRALDRVDGFPDGCLTQSPEALLEAADIVFECTGDVPYAARLAGTVLDAGRPLVTLDAEFHVALGAAFVGRGYLTEAEGDQPGSTARLALEARQMGFRPLVYGNMKGFLNHTPTPEEMHYWAGRQGISLPMVTAFTDGTKLQIEQCLIGNFEGADIAQEGLSGLATADLAAAAQTFGEKAVQHGRPLTDYIIDGGLPHGVFVVAEHDPGQAAALRHLKMGDGPHYVLEQPTALVHLEVFRTLERVIGGAPALLHNTPTPRLSVAAVAKRALLPGEQIARGCGSFELRGAAVRIADRPDHLPIGLANAVRVRRKVDAGEVLTFDDVDLADADLVALWRGIVGASLARFAGPAAGQQ